MNMVETKSITPHLDILRSEMARAVDGQWPFTVRKDEVLALRASLQEQGVKLDLGETERKSMASPQFRARYDEESGHVQVYSDEEWKEFTPNSELEGKNLGLVAMLGEKRFGDFVQWSAQKGSEHNWKTIGKAEHPGTRGRGIQLVGASLLQMAILEPDDPAYDDTRDDLVRSINRRLWRGQQIMNIRSKASNEKKASLNSRFAECGEEPKLSTASIPPSVLPEVLTYFESL